MERCYSESAETISSTARQKVFHGAAKGLTRNRHRRCDSCAQIRIFKRRKSFESSFNFNKNSRKLFSSRISKISRVIFIFFVTHKSLLAHAAVVTSVPQYMDLEASLEASKCDVREQIVDLRKVHPTLPTEAILLPSCVALHQCSGCCQSEEVQCVPTSVYTTRMQIMQQIIFPEPSYNEITLEFTHHASCACKSMDDTTPVCVQKACAEGQTWDPGECTCGTTLNVACVPEQCGDEEYWSEETCRCESHCRTQSCLRGEQWNPSSCLCIPACPIFESCLFGQVWDRRVCGCVQKCQAEDCNANQIWNPETCRCQCRPCHPRRLYHIRFNQNSETCQCTCRSERRGRAACEKRRAEFNAKICTCEYAYAIHRRIQG